MMQKGGRTKQSQEIEWSKVHERISNYIKKNPDDELATLLAQSRALDLGRVTMPNKFYDRRPFVKDFAKNILKKHDANLNDEFLFPDISEKKYSINNISPIRYLMSLVRSDTSAIVELGSGWSSNLFQTYIGLGRTRSKDLTYIGAEYTDEGRACARTIANFDTKIHLLDYNFDYRNPEISFLNKFKKHILVFTSHSIEQVDLINDKLYQDLHNLDAKITLVHIEPIGWQRDTDLLKARESGSDKVFEQIESRFENSISSEKHQLENSAWWSWRLNYNINLLRIIEKFQSENKIDLAYKAYDYSGVSNILNPASLFRIEFKE